LQGDGSFEIKLAYHFDDEDTLKAHRGAYSIAFQGAMVIDEKLLEILRCPETGSLLTLEGAVLINAEGSQRYGVVDGIPLLISSSLDSTHAGYQKIVEENKIEAIAEHISDAKLERFLNEMILSTCGNLVNGVELKGDYPLGEFPKFKSGMILDLGCNWGRWAIAGAMSDQRVIGVDIHLKSLRCTKALAHKICPENMPHFVLADARRMPFAEEAISGVFSYSVVQHLSKTNAGIVLTELSRVMRPGAKSIIQMPNRRGVYATLKRIRSGVKDDEFDVRYYEISEMLELFTSRIGSSSWCVDCFIGLNVHARDMRFVPWAKRWIVVLNELILCLSRYVRPLAHCADSIYLHSQKPAQSRTSIPDQKRRPTGMT
jgi:SAM-dependent methyltransferase/uncharacterized protein YbaR (Trm112 family)